MNKKCLIIVSLLLLILAGGIYKFILQGSTVQHADQRITILLSEDERALVLTEMRAFLQSVQQISQGIAEDNLELVATSARKSGKAAQDEVPGTLVGKLPLQFKKWGRDTHMKFDQLALDAEDLEDGSYALEQLSTLMQNCVTCHATYRIDI